jgi:hypothetical protein
MMDVVNKKLDEHGCLTKLQAESYSLDKELLAAYRKKSRLGEERKTEDKTTEYSRARQDELLASNRCKEDAATASRRKIVDEECDRVKEEIMRKQIVRLFWTWQYFCSLKKQFGAA